MISKPLSFDAATGTEKIFHYDPDADRFFIETKQDVTDLLELNKAAASQQESGWRGDWHHVAEIPLNLFYELKAKGIADDPKRFKAWLNDPENRFFRTKLGRV